MTVTELNKWLKELYTRLKNRTSGQMTRLQGTVLLLKPNERPREDVRAFCGEIGHKSVDCWERAENRGKCPKNWTSKMTDSQQTAQEHAFASSKSLCTIC